MKFSFVSVGETKSGRYKVYAIGQPSYHLMDWRGCNYRYIPLPGQPHRGFETADQAAGWFCDRFTKKEIKDFCHQRGDGNFLSDTDSAIELSHERLVFKEEK